MARTTTPEQSQTRLDYSFRTELRVPEELAGMIRKLAQQEDRSFNAQVVYMLRRAVKEWAAA